MWFNLIWFDALQCDHEVFSSSQVLLSSRKTEPSINLEHTTPCARAHAQNLLIRSVFLTEYGTKLIWCFFCLLCIALSSLKKYWLINLRTIMVRSNQFDASIYQYTILSKFIKFWQSSFVVVVLIVWSNITSTILSLMINRNRCNDFISYFILQALHSRNVVKKLLLHLFFTDQLLDQCCWMMMMFAVCSLIGIFDFNQWLVLKCSNFLLLWFHPNLLSILSSNRRIRKAVCNRMGPLVGISTSY